MNPRRRAVLAFGVGAAVCPAVPRAQPGHPGPARVGLLSFGNPPGGPPDPSSGLFEGLRDLGYVEGRNLVIEARYADGRFDRLAGLAAELVQRKVAVIVAGGPATIMAARAATTTIPIVAIGGVDPVGEGWAQSLAHPGGNQTGLTVTFPGMGPKLLEVLKEARPKMVRAAALGVAVEMGVRFDNPIWTEAARGLGLEMQWLDVNGAPDLEPALARAAQGGAQGLLAVATNLIVSHRHTLAELAQRYRMPTISEFGLMAQAGIMLSYGADLAALNRRAAAYVDKILKGARPGDLPIEQPTQFEFIVNLRTARALGLALPATTLRRADRIIE